MRRSLSFEISNRATGLRIDRLLLEALQQEDPGATRSRLKAAFQNGAVQLDGRPVKPSHIPEAGTLRIEIRDWTQAGAPARPSPEGPFLAVLYEDSDLLVLDKAPGIPSVPHSAEETRSAVGSALAQFPQLQGIGHSPLEPGLLHRLDTGTSGVLLFAKSQAEFDRLRAAWKTPAVVKIYRTIVDGPVPGPALGVLSPLLGHDARSSRRMRAITEGQEDRIRGKPLPTVTRIIEKSELGEKGYDLEIEIETGVMHQIRCTLAELGWPVRGDDLYKGAPSERLWLHAWRLSLEKKDGTRLVVESHLPKDWPV